MTRLLTDSKTQWLSYHILRCVYNVLFHPLRDFPGPKLGAATQALNVWYIIRGTNCKYLYDLHEKYGDVVRTGPNELSFRTVSAIKTIYGGNPGSDNTFHKNMIANMQETGESNNLFFATGDKHMHYRKLIAPTLAEATIRQQEPMILDYCDQLVRGLRDRSGVGNFPDSDGVVDMVPWTNFIVSDILSHMLFGSGLDCVRLGKHHPWTAAGYDALIESTYIEAAHRLWPYHKICEYFWIPTRMSEGFRTHVKISRLKLSKRSEETRPYRFDFPSFLSGAMSEEELFDNINVIATAAGETTSSTISAALYYLTQNAVAYRRLTTEIRTTFQREEDITAASTASCLYLKASIKETFRIHPTIPVGLHRVTPMKGKRIDGMWVPGGTWVAVANLAACRSPSFWNNPDHFRPERWTGDAKFDSDNRDISVPYSIGIRNCVGMSHANTQLRIILARLLWSFDFEACPGNTDPHDFLEYGTWQVEPLRLRVTNVHAE